MGPLDTSKLRIGAPPAFCTRVLTCGLDASAEADFEEWPVPVLCERLQRHLLDVALLPPLEALRFGPCRVVPGIGIAAMPESLRQVEAARRLLEMAEAGEDRTPEFLASPGEALPIVFWLWACRPRAPYPRLRRVLAQAHQRGLADLDELAQQAERRFEIGAADAVQALTALSFRIGGAEADSLRRIAAWALDRGLCPPGAGFEFC